MSSGLLEGLCLFEKCIRIWRKYICYTLVNNIVSQSQYIATESVFLSYVQLLLLKTIKFVKWWTGVQPYTLEFDKKSCFRMVLKSHRLSFARKNGELRSNIEWYSFEWFVVCPQSSDSSVGFTWCSCLVLILVSLVGFYLS